MLSFMGCYIQHYITSDDLEMTAVQSMQQSLFPSKAEFIGYKVKLYGKLGIEVHPPQDGTSNYAVLPNNEHRQVPVVPPNAALEITIPEGMMPGMRFPVAIPDTSDVTIYTVPAGVRPGMRVLVPIQEAVPAAVYTPPLQEPTIQVVAQEAAVVGEAQISSELLAWFASFGVTNPACLQQLAPLIEQVGVTEPDELVDVADDEEAGATWIDEVVGILPLVKRKKFRQAIEDMRQNQK